MTRVVITGMGIYSVIGKNLQEVEDSLRHGRSGIVFDPLRKAMGFRSALTGMVERPHLKGVLDRRLRIGLPVQGEYAYISTLEALKHAGIEQSYLDANEVGPDLRNRRNELVQSVARARLPLHPGDR